MYLSTLQSVTSDCVCLLFCTYTILGSKVRCVPMQTGREGVCRHAILKSCDKIPPAMSYRQMKRILPLYAKCQLSLRQILISILKMKAGVRTHECNFALDSFVGGGGWGGGREQTPCIDWCNPNPKWVWF